MKERPILFSSVMVQAILDGRKTQTRRVIKPQPELSQFGDGTWIWKGKQDRFPQVRECSYGQPGDRLWVRETWFADPPYDGTWDEYAFSDGIIENFSVLPDRFKSPEFVLYRSTWKGVDLRWRPSIFMPRWASRITLEIVNVRVERLLDISKVDARSEGMYCGFEPPYDFRIGPYDAYTANFRRLWDKINAKRGFGWDQNPLVWVIEFKRV